MITALTLVAVPLQPAAALQATAVTLQHTNPIEAPAGDNVTLAATVTRTCALTSTCSGVRFAVTYVRADGSETSITTYGSESSDPQALSVTVPGEEIRYPTFRYYLTAWVEEQYVVDPNAQPQNQQSSQNAQNAQVVQKRFVGVRNPTTGYYETSIYNLLRFFLELPDGSPAANVHTWATPIDGGESTGWEQVESWAAVSDASGKVSIRVPADDPILTVREANEHYANVLIKAYDNFPATPPTNGGTLTTQGHGGFIATTLQLGHPDLEATDRDVRDAVFKLADQDQTFRANDDPDDPQALPSCPKSKDELYRGEHRSCRKLMETYTDKILPLNKNVGAGGFMNGSFEYHKSLATSTEIVVEVKGKWIAAEGSTKTEKNTSAENNTGYFPERTNQSFRIRDDWRRYQVQECSRTGDFDASGDHMTCLDYIDGQYIYPYRWTGGLEPTSAGNTYSSVPHDEYSTHGGCPSVTTGEIKSETAKGQRRSYSIDFGGDIGSIGLKATTKYSQANAFKSIYHWKVVDPLGSFPLGPRTHFVYVPADQLKEEDQGACYVDKPDMAYTDYIYGTLDTGVSLP